MSNENYKSGRAKHRGIAVSKLGALSMKCEQLVDESLGISKLEIKIPDDNTR